MEPIEIIVIVFCVFFVGGVIGNYIYRKVKHKPTGECAYCKPTSKGSKLVNAYHKKYGKKSPNKMNEN